jgi:hypothetical protein
MTKRDEARSRSFSASMVSRRYSMVRSNSPLASCHDLQISHIMMRTTSVRRAAMRRAKSSTWRMRSATPMVGHAPMPSAQARSAASTARRAAASSRMGQRPSKRGVKPPAASISPMGENTCCISPGAQAFGGMGRGRAGGGASG